jgi:hypothetical protein
MRHALKSLRSRLFAPAGPAAILLACACVAGCGDSDPSAYQTETQKEYAAKVQSLMKEGKTLAEIRAIMRGEQLPKKKPAKARAKHK